MKFFSYLLLFMTMTFAINVNAQQIAVVTPNGTTTVHQTLQDAIEQASDGSVIYIPGGGFTIEDSVFITKKINIIGTGHKSNSDNIDGNTLINGNLWFNQGSGGSSLIGCYLTGDVKIGEDGLVDNVLVKLCNINSVQVMNEGISGTYINQNYIRSISNFFNSSCYILNNVMHSVRNVKDGVIKYNTICSSRGGRDDDYSLCDIESSQIYYNIIKGRGLSGNYYGFWDPFRGSNCMTGWNMVVGDHYGKTFGDNPIIISAQGSDCFINVTGGYSWWNISPNLNYHFTDEYKQYESQVGIYAGDGFSDGAIPPAPYIVAKRIAEQTDAEGKLRVQIRVNAGPSN